jgi:phosphatidylglycerophosphate synthase
MRNAIYRNLPNIVSILGFLPIGLLLMEDGYRFLIPLIVFNNVMDDLDGILAARLNLKSPVGAILDNVCDTVAHTLFVLVAGMHFGGVCAAACVAATVGIMLRVADRLSNPSGGAKGSPTNELIRHMFFLLLAAEILSFNPAPFLVAVFLVHSVSMLVSFPMPHMIRSRARSVFAICLVNLTLAVAWLAPSTTLVIAVAFVTTYLVSFSLGVYRYLRKSPEEERTEVEDSFPDRRARPVIYDQ